jgi:hypothetical protein
MTQTLAFQALRTRHQLAKRAIVEGRLTDAEIRKTFELSETAFRQLSAIVRAGCVS